MSTSGEYYGESRENWPLAPCVDRSALAKAVSDMLLSGVDSREGQAAPGLTAVLHC